jgi:hypothetical protein
MLLGGICLKSVADNHDMDKGSTLGRRTVLVKNITLRMNEQNIESIYKLHHSSNLDPPQRPQFFAFIH